MSDAGDVRAELHALARAFVDRLGHAQRRGVRWIGGSPSPRVAPLTDDTLTRPSRAEDTMEEDTVEVEPVEETGQDATAGAASLQDVREELGDCTRCPLHQGRRHIVFGCGNPQADLMLIGEAPGAEEDRQGEPFVGPAGQLLTRMLSAMGLTRDDVYIANILKCRPPRNRDPEPDEVESCEPFLRRQIDSIGPRLIIALGAHAARTLLRSTAGINALRGRFHDHQGRPLMPTFHPSYLLRNAAAKRPAWQDLQQVMTEMDRLGLHRRRD